MLIFWKTIKQFYGREQGEKIMQSLEPQCLSGFKKDELFRIQHSDIIIAVDAGDFIFYDCVYEEVLQSLGPINDDNKLPWTMFNDEVQMGFFDIYDQYIMNLLYDPRIRAGMSKEQVKELLRRERAYRSMDTSSRIGSSRSSEPRTWSLSSSGSAIRCASTPNERARPTKSTSGTTRSIAR